MRGMPQGGPAMSKGAENAGAWPVWAALLLALGFALGLGIYRHFPGDDDGRGPAAFASAGPGEVLLNGWQTALAGIQARPPARRGGELVVPAAAVLYVDGKASVYVETSPGDFHRKILDGAVAAPGGYLGRIPGWVSGQEVVTRGAALLLSQEFRPKAPAGDGDDDD